MNVYEAKRKALGHHCPGFGGDSSQDSTNNIAIDNSVTDNRIGITSTVTNTNSGNTTSMFSNWDTSGGSVQMSNVGNVVSDSYNTTSVTYTDHDAVAGAFAATTQNTGMVMALADKLATGATSVASKNADLTAQLSQDSKAAFSGAAAQASGQNTFIFIAMAVVALAYIVVKK